MAGDGHNLNGGVYGRCNLRRHRCKLLKDRAMQLSAGMGCGYPNSGYLRCAESLALDGSSKTDDAAAEDDWFSPSLALVLEAAMW